ncbi:hypothetical protein [Streptomyces sp. NBC_00557]|uniref:hypothetical protein n=1 Tax=Streptomyces sp. NBC_00557 TaxID=2975776 RepID=UPI002E800B95|nr:hypothetical protein [Streptomyces sp. NBC_00557]WUC36361.1 hypothetical protein OG956_20130 [Streptomyces sp. NBC_00557]
MTAPATTAIPLPAEPGQCLIAGLACTAAGALCFLAFLITATCEAIHHRTRRTTMRRPRRYQHAAVLGALLLAAAGTTAGLHHLYAPAAAFGLGVLVLTEAALRERRRRPRRAAAQAFAAMDQADAERRAADEAFAALLPHRMDAAAAELTRQMHEQGVPADMRLEWGRD